MFHMLTCFNLKSDISVEDFQKSLQQFSAHLVDADLLLSTGPIGRRQTDTIMDTDEERNHKFFFITSFRDREQCDRSVDYVMPHEEPGESFHTAVLTKVEDPIFICWEDI
jgi:hypothetical protein